jgi:AcrR family transcriptional regulator
VPRPKVHDDDLRRRILDRAGRIVTEHGPDALSLRTLAADAGTSTSAIYTLFGGRTELFSALFVAAFQGFGASQRAVPATDEPLGDLYALGIAYRTWALSNPQLYRVMFGGVLPPDAVSADDWDRCQGTMEPLQAAVARALGAGVITGSVDLVAHALWATVHGLVSLELTMLSAVPDDDRLALFRAALAAAVRGWAPEG